MALCIGLDLVIFYNFSFCPKKAGRGEGGGGGDERRERVERERGNGRKERERVGRRGMEGGEGRRERERRDRDVHDYMEESIHQWSWPPWCHQ